MPVKEYRQCTRCVLDTTTATITFDDNGVCNYCYGYNEAAKATVLRPKEIRDAELNRILRNIKEAGKGQEYDCIVGISGGIDSSYMAVLVKEFGLRPLLVHFDNGWDSELAVKNIEHLVTKLDYNLYTYVIDWEEFKDLQIAYFKASVIDIEVPTDQLIFAILFKIARENNIKYILEGYNFRTEYGIPGDWNFDKKFDLTNLCNIHKKFGKIKLKKFPTISESDLLMFDQVYNIKAVGLLNLVDYDWLTVKKLLMEKFDYTPYQYKHYESIFTRFYQGYILPKKFKIDKRLAHLSTLIRSGFITREYALNELKNPPYPIEQQNEDRAYVIKKWDMTEEEFEAIMNKPIESHDVYGYDKVSNWAKIKVKLYMIYLYKFAYPLGIKKRPAKN